MEVKKSPKADLSKSSTMFFEIGLIAALAIVLIAFEWRSKEIKKAELSANDIIAEKHTNMTADIEIAAIDFL